jgi:UDP-N-acetylmuramyl pentapeptide phosphotransferase/UDP-N-acetylglucosamine-1-phosphate transferase
VAAGLILSLLLNLRFTSFHGFLGVHEIPLWTSLAVTIFLIVIIINSLNLIDGIDGLAASIGIVASTTFGIWSYLSHDYGFAIMSAALTGALAVFLFFNMSKGKYKIFMGDTGSLVIGFILVALMIRFNELNAGSTQFHKLSSSPAVSIAILIVPLFDTLRVIIIRFARGQSPLVADRRHIHHLLLRAGCTHARATLYIALANIAIIFLAFSLDHIGIFRLSFVLLILCTALTIPVYIGVARKENWNWRKAKLRDIIFRVRETEDLEVIREKPVPPPVRIPVLEEEKYTA